MDKKFDEWNEIKKKTNNINREIGLKSREIYWLKMGENVGYEQSGKGNINITALIVQLKVFSVKRIMNKIGMINKDDFEILLEKTHNLIAPTKKLVCSKANFGPT